MAAIVAVGLPDPLLSPPGEPKSRCSVLATACASSWAKEERSSALLAGACVCISSKKQRQGSAWRGVGWGGIGEGMGMWLDGCGVVREDVGR